jgi:hypothetical protein
MNKHRKQTPHEQLLNQWAALPHHRGKCFIRDGIIDATRWEKAPRKLLLILREAHGEPEETEGWDLRDVIRKDWGGPKYKVWWTVAYWAYLVHKGSVHRVPPFPADDSAWNAAREALLSAAAINIKKSSGKLSSDWDNLKMYAKTDGQLIRRQVDLIDPQIVICGNLWPLIENLWPDAKDIYGPTCLADGRFFIDFWHPANQFPDDLNYFALAHLLQSSGALGRCPADRRS